VWKGASFAKRFSEDVPGALGLDKVHFLKGNLLVLYDQSSDPPPAIGRTAMCPWLTSLVKNEPLLWAQFVTGMHLLQIHPPSFLETPMPLETRFES